MKTITVELGQGKSYDFITAVEVAREVVEGEFHLKLGLASVEASSPSPRLRYLLRDYLAGSYALIFTSPHDATMFGLAYQRSDNPDV
ncbi:MAG: hypothetical protein EOO77_29250 [Oxalobacteraceae bacterium]|nr:MAG: hypothetical protein EOO77_29250 [Oxalobacteraceae bacterium]